MSIKVVITGFSEEHLSLGAINALKDSKNVVLHTERCYISDWLKNNDIEYTSFDDLYEQAADFDAHVESAVSRLKEMDEVCFCVMDTSDETAKAIISRRPNAEVYGGAFSGLEIRSTDKLMVISATDAVSARLSPRSSIIVRELDNRLLAGEVKLKLEQVYGEEATAYFLLPEGKVISIKLCDLDRLKRYDHSCACLINPVLPVKMHDFECLKLISDAEAVKDDAFDEEGVAKMLACVVKSIKSGEARLVFTEEDVFERAADILTKGE